MAYELFSQSRKPNKRRGGGGRGDGGDGGANKSEGTKGLEKFLIKNKRGGPLIRVPRVKI